VKTTETSCADVTAAETKEPNTFIPTDLDGPNSAQQPAVETMTKEVLREMQESSLSGPVDKMDKQEGKKMRQPGESAPAPAARLVDLAAQLRQTFPLSPKRDEDNYEISDKGENSDDGETEPDRSHKHVPRWCETFLKDLQAQSSWDPDSIFGLKVPACVLDVVFTDDHYRAAGKERPRRKRGSSQDWKKDRLRSQEVKEYKRKMGHAKPWNMVCKMPLDNRSGNPSTS
jgi:hypothetical protein